jgi:hypothetical protein
MRILTSLYLTADDPNMSFATDELEVQPPEEEKLAYVWLRMYAAAFFAAACHVLHVLLPTTGMTRRILRSSYTHRRSAPWRSRRGMGAM